MNLKGVIAALCFSLVLGLSACSLSYDEEKQVNIERGSDIIQAINDFEQAQGRFPEHLDELVPEYMAEIPQTVQGKDFNYHVLQSSQNQPGYFNLGFELASRPNRGCGYDSIFENWECGFGH